MGAVTVWGRIARHRYRSGIEDHGGPTSADRVVHDLRRSGVKHLINAGIDPHTGMAFSEHRTPAMLRWYRIIGLDDSGAQPKAPAPTPGPAGPCPA